MVKTKETNTKPRISFDLLTSPSEEEVSSISSLDNTNNESVRRKHSVSTLRKHHRVSKRLNNVHSQLIDKYKIEKMAVFQQNHQIALELDKHKQLIQFKNAELLEYQKDIFEHKEYILELKRENETLLQSLKQVHNITKPFMSIFSPHRRSSFTSNNTSVATESHKFPIIAFDVPTMNKMQQLELENNKKKDKDVYEFDEDENNQVVLPEFEVVENSGRMAKIVEGDEEEEEEKEEVIKAVKKPSNRKKEGKTLKKIEKGKHVSFEKVDSDLVKQDFTIYRDTNSIEEIGECFETPPKNTYYEELENRPVIVNNLTKNKSKKVLTPKNLNKNKKVLKDVVDEDKKLNDEKQQVELNIQQEAQSEEEEVITAPDKENNKRKSIKKSSDRRRSHVFSPFNQTDEQDVPQPINVVEVENEAVAIVVAEKPLMPQNKKRLKKLMATDENTKQPISNQKESKKDEGSDSSEDLILPKRCGTKLIIDSDEEIVLKQDAEDSNKEVKLKRSNNSKSKLKIEEKSDEVLNTEILKPITNSPSELKVIRIKGGGKAAAPLALKGTKKQTTPVEIIELNETYVLSEKDPKELILDNSLNGPLSSTSNEIDLSSSSKNHLSFTSTNGLSVNCPPSVNSSLNP
jgi:hypothetical protein